MEQNKTETALPGIRMIRNGTAVLPILGVIIALTLSGGLVLDFEAENGHFAFGAPSFYMMTAGVVLAAVLAAVLGKQTTAKFSLTAVPDSAPLSTCAAFFTAFMAIVTAAVFFYETFILRCGASTLELLAHGFLPAVTVSMILGAFEKTRCSTLHVLFSILAALAINLNMFACYFDFTLPLNSAVRNLITIAQAGVTLFLLSEARLALSPQTRASAPFFVFTSAFAASAVFGISFGLCVFAFVSPHAASMNIPIDRFACYFGIALLAFSRLRALPDAAGPYVPPPTEEEEKNADPSPDDPR